MPGFAFGWFSNWLVTLGSSLVICPITAPRKAPCPASKCRIQQVAMLHCSPHWMLSPPVHAASMLWFLSMIRRLLLLRLQGCTTAYPLRLQTALLV